MENFINALWSVSQANLPSSESESLLQSSSTDASQAQSSQSAPLASSLELVELQLNHEIEKLEALDKTKKELAKAITKIEAQQKKIAIDSIDISFTSTGLRPLNAQRYRGPVLTFCETHNSVLADVYGEIEKIKSNGLIANMALVPKTPLPKLSQFPDDTNYAKVYMATSKSAETLVDTLKAINKTISGKRDELKEKRDNLLAQKNSLQPPVLLANTPEAPQGLRRR